MKLTPYDGKHLNCKEYHIHLGKRASTVQTNCQANSKRNGANDRHGPRHSPDEESSRDAICRRTRREITGMVGGVADLTSITIRELRPTLLNFCGEANNVKRNTDSVGKVEKQSNRAAQFRACCLQKDASSALSKKDASQQYGAQKRHVTGATD